MTTAIRIRKSREDFFTFSMCHLPVPWDHPVASNMGPPRVHFGRLT
jgi:hypothetical protein